MTEDAKTKSRKDGSSGKKKNVAQDPPKDKRVSKKAVDTFNRANQVLKGKKAKDAKGGGPGSGAQPAQPEPHKLPKLFKGTAYAKQLDALPPAVRAALIGQFASLDADVKAEEAFFAKWDSFDAILTDASLKTGPLQPGDDPADYQITRLAEMKTHLEAAQDRHDKVMGVLSQADEQAKWAKLAKQHDANIDYPNAGKRDDNDADLLKEQKALLRGRMIAEAMKSHLPQQLANALSQNQLDRLDDLALDANAKQAALKALLKKHPTDAEKADERKPFETIIRRHGAKDADHFDVFSDQLLHPPSLVERQRIIDATDAAAALVCNIPP